MTGNNRTRPFKPNIIVSTFPQWTIDGASMAGGNLVSQSTQDNTFLNDRPPDPAAAADRPWLYDSACAIRYLAFRSATRPDEKRCGWMLAEDLC